MGEEGTALRGTEDKKEQRVKLFTILKGHN